MKKTDFCALGLCVAVAAVFLCAGCNDSGVENIEGGAVTFLRTFKGGINDSTDITVPEIVYGPPLIDERDGQEYRTVKLGSQMWMAENLNYEPDSGNSWCYGNSAENCAKYGRLYDWATAMGLDTSYNHKKWDSKYHEKQQGICPVGWHLPLESEAPPPCLNVYESRKLKAKTGWSVNGESSGNGTDDCGFAALPGGYREEVYGDFLSVGEIGYWWISGERVSSPIPYRNIRTFGLSSRTDDFIFPEIRVTTVDWLDSDGKEIGCSVRCVQD